MRNMILFVSVLVTIGISMLIGIGRASSAVAAPLSPVPAAQAFDTPPPLLLPDTLSTGSARREHESVMPAASIENVPHIGSVQVLNGCGVPGVADRMADFLRARNFDVKDIGNAPSWNYPETMIIARNSDMALAREIEKSLRTGDVTLIRNRDGHLYDVTVVVGPDYEKKIK